MTSRKLDQAVTLDEYITSVLTCIAQGINNCNSTFDELDPIFTLAGGDDHFIEFQIAVELVKKASTAASGKAGFKIPYLSVAGELSARDASEGSHHNLVKFKVRSTERAAFRFRNAGEK